MFKRRSEIEIIGEILGLSRDGAKKTEILYQSNTSFSQLQHYLTFLLDKNIIKENIVVSGNGKSNKVYVTTEKGINLLEKINNLYTYFK
jgi:predicted transcriptional regulator